MWTSLKANLDHNDALSAFVRKYSDVEHVTGRGSTSLAGRGPVLMAWADMDDIAQLLRFNSSRVRSLCVVYWQAEWLRPWVAVMKPEILGDGSEWDQPADELDPVVVEALKDLTLSVNHNNVITAGFEKDDVVSTLLALRAAGIPMNGPAMQAWVLANGWSGDNPKHLAKYVDNINAGKRPRVRDRGRDGRYIDRLRRRASGLSDEGREH